MALTAAQRRYLRNLGAHLTGFYGAKGFDLLILSAVTRTVPMAQVGTAFFADAVGDALFRFADFGLFPVLFRRAARGQAGAGVLASATLLRAAGVAFLTAPFVAVTALYFPEQASLATAFFVLAGVYDVHEVPRALLAGRERFAITATAGLSTKFLEAACTLYGLWAGAGVWAWVAGRTVSQLGMLVACYVFARREVRQFESPRTGVVLREGLPFWFAAAASAGFSQLDTIVVGSYLGLVETAHLGIASRVVGGVLSFVGSMTNVAFPELARLNRRFASPNQVRVVSLVAIGLTLPLIVAAPVIVRIVAGRFDPAITTVLRAMAPVVAFATFGRALTAWLRAKNKERRLAVLTVGLGGVSAASLFFLVPVFGTRGAAFARVFGEAATTVALGALAYAGAHRIHRPISWLVTRIPAVRRRVLDGLGDVVARLGRGFAEARGVRQVEVTGSAADPRLFRPGESDLDFIVTTETRGAELSAVALHCDRVASTAGLTGPVMVQLVAPAVLEWARRAGHPVLTRRTGRTLAGPPCDPPVDVESAQHWALTHAFTLAVRVQADAIEDGHDDGATRADRIAKDFRFFLTRLGEPADVLRGLRDAGFSLPEWLAGTGRVPRWISPEVTAEILRACHHALGASFAEASRSWPVHAVRTPAVPAWLQAVSERLAPTIASLAAALSPTAIHLTPTGPTEDDPMLVLVADAWPPDRWSRFVRLAAGQSRLGLPFRAYRWPIVLPAAVHSADVLMEHAVLLHLARANGVDAFGASPPRRTPPPDVFRAAARRETLQALVRIPRDAVRVRREAAWQPGLLTEPVGQEDPWRFRVRAFTSGRLAALSLLVDHGLALSDRASVVGAYVERYDDALATWHRDRPEGAPGARVSDVLSDWAAGRVERLSAWTP